MKFCLWERPSFLHAVAFGMIPRCSFAWKICSCWCHFILISQAALLGHRGRARGLPRERGPSRVLVRFASPETFFQGIKFAAPRVVVRAGAAAGQCYCAAPWFTRHLHETKIGTKPTEGAAYHGLNRYSWLVLLPRAVRAGQFHAESAPDRRPVAPTSLVAVGRAGTLA